MKKVSILLLALCLIFMTACGTASPTDALKADLENAKSSPDEIIGQLGEDGFGEEATQALVNKVLEFDYQLGEEKIDGDKATVETTITTYPFGEIFTSIVGDFVTQAFANPDMTDDDASALLDQLLMDALDKADKTYSKTITIELAQEDGKWVVQESDEMSNALTGGMLDFAAASSGSK
ncbi:MAG: hypothetical protein SO251_08540 [Candidatus Fimisoma sp.]|nr:hypothetical protein [Bacillota bacterium]MDY4748805.1 hypothetical protein [Candidatus Fimisoma sp.]